MQDLQHDGGQSGLRHGGEVGVDLPRHAVRPEQTGVAWRSAVHRRIVVATGAPLEIGDDAPAHLGDDIAEGGGILRTADRVFALEDEHRHARHAQLARGRELGPHLRHTLLAGQLVEEIEARGPLSSLELEEDTRMDWWLAGSVRAARIALDILLYGGETVVHHRIGTRRYFELSERVLPPDLINAAEPHASEEEYLEWHVFRRAGGLGLVDLKVTAEWGGTIGWRGGRIRAAVLRLAEKGRFVPVAVEDLPRQRFFVRREDLPAPLLTLLGAVTGLVGLSRVYLGAHHATDVIAGIARHFAPPAYQPQPAFAAETERLRFEDRDFALWLRSNVVPHRQPGYVIVNLSLKPEGAPPGDASSAQMDAVADLADAHVRALEHLDRGGASGTYNVGTERPSSVRDVLATVERVCGHPVSRRTAPRRAGERSPTGSRL